MLEKVSVHPSWDDFLTEEIKDELEKIKGKIGSNYNPTEEEKILRFLTIDLNKVRIIWLGQDVYPAKGVATGRAFEIGNLTSWQEPFRQSSLRNIVRAIYKMDQNISGAKTPPTFSFIRKEIKEKRFLISPPPKWFDSLERQGVLFLNTSFTCEVSKPNSHKKYWQKFSNAVLHFISTVKPNIIYFLWGKEAQSYKKIIKNGRFYESRHPSRVSSSYEDDFLKFDGFEKTKHIVNWLG